MLEVSSDTCQDSLIKVPKFVLNLENIVNDKLADSLLNLLADFHFSLSNTLSRFRSVKDMRSFTVERNSDHHLRVDFKTVKHVSEHVLPGTMYVRDLLTPIRMQISVIQLTYILLETYQKALGRSHRMNSDTRRFLVPTVINGLMSSSSPDVSWKNTDTKREQYFLPFYRTIVIKARPR